MTFAAIAIAFYLCATLFLGLQLRRHPNLKTSPLYLFSLLAIGFHSAACFQWVVTDSGFYFGLAPMTSLIFLAINSIVLLSSLRRPVHNLFLLLYPITALVLLAKMIGGEAHPAITTNVATTIGAHIILSLLAYSLLTIASFQALLLAWQNWRLRHKHLGGLLGKAIPPLQTMEELLFEVLWSGFILLTLSLASGLLFYEDFLAQKLIHKTAFSLLAWAFYAVLLWGRHAWGWRGKTAIRLTLTGFTAIALGYWGSKFVLEVVLV